MKNVNHKIMQQYFRTTSPRLIHTFRIYTVKKIRGSHGTLPVNSEEKQRQREKKSSQKFNAAITFILSAKIETPRTGCADDAAVSSDEKNVGLVCLVVRSGS